MDISFKSQCYKQVVVGGILHWPQVRLVQYGGFWVSKLLSLCMWENLHWQNVHVSDTLTSSRVASTRIYAYSENYSIVYVCTHTHEGGPPKWNLFIKIVYLFLHV